MGYCKDETKELVLKMEIGLNSIKNKQSIIEMVGVCLNIINGRL